MTKWLAMICLTVLSLTPRAALPQPPPLFLQGTVQIGGIAGVTVGAGRSSFLLGASAGYFVLDGLRLGAEGDVWFGPGPTVGRIGPNLTYVFFFAPAVQPYVGGFYRRWFVGAGRPDLDTVGGRAGIYRATANAIFGIGVMYERLLGTCMDGCYRVSPELSLAFVF